MFHRERERGRRKGRSLRTRRYDFSFNNHDGTIPARRITLPTRVSNEYLHSPYEINGHDSLPFSPALLVSFFFFFFFLLRLYLCSPVHESIAILRSSFNYMYFFFFFTISQSVVSTYSRVAKLLMTRSYRTSPTPHREKLRLNDPGENIPRLTTARRFIFSTTIRINIVQTIFPLGAEFVGSFVIRAAKEMSGDGGLWWWWWTLFGLGKGRVKTFDMRVRPWHPFARQERERESNRKAKLSHASACHS